MLSIIKISDNSIIAQGVPEVDLEFYKTRYNNFDLESTTRFNADRFMYQDVEYLMTEYALLNDTDIAPELSSTQYEYIGGEKANILNPSDGDVVVYNNGQWTNGAPAQKRIIISLPLDTSSTGTSFIYSSYVDVDNEDIGRWFLAKYQLVYGTRMTLEGASIISQLAIDQGSTVQSSSEILLTSGIAVPLTVLAVVQLDASQIRIKILEQNLGSSLGYKAQGTVELFSL